MSVGAIRIRTIVFTAMVCGGVWLNVPAAQALHCGTITDPYAQAKCNVDEQKASGLVGGGILAPNMSRVPQYSGSPTCTTAGCSGASQEGYFSTSGSVGTLNSDAAAATTTDPRYTDMGRTQLDKTSWDLTSSTPVVTSTAVAGTITSGGVMGSTCTTTPVCTAYGAGPPTINTCQSPGTSRETCYRTETPTLTAAACTSPGLSSPPYHTESLSDGCATYVSMASAGNATRVSSTCLDSAPRTLTCSQPYAATLTGGNSNGYAHDHSPGTAQGYYTIQSASPYWDGTRWSVSLQVIGNSSGENKYGCTSPYGGAVGPVTINPPSPSASAMGYAPFCNRRCGCWGYGMTFSMGTLVTTGTNTWSLPFTFQWEAHVQNVVVTGQFFDSYTVAPQTGCWNTEEVWDINTTIPDTCSTYRSTTGCNQISSTCIDTQPGTGYCRVYENQFSCAGGTVCTSTTAVTSCSRCGLPGSPVPFCVDTSTPPNDKLALSATWLQILKDVENDWDPTNLKIFTGTRRSCDYSTIGTAIINCCDTDPTRLLGSCSAEEIQLATDRQKLEAHQVGDHCVEWVSLGLGRVCTRREEVYCSYHSELARLIQEQGRPQLGLTFGTVDTPDCTGFTVTQFTALNFAAMDFTEWYRNIAANIDATAVTSAMRAKVCAITGC